MIRLFSRRLSSALNIFPLPAPTYIPPYPPSNDNKIEMYPHYNETITKTNDGNSGYRILIEVCHESKSIYMDEDMSDYDKLNDLPKFIKTLGCLYPNYTLKK